VHIVGHRLAAQQVDRNHLELRRGTTLQEQHLVVGRNAHQFAQVGFGLGGDAHELLAAVAHFHDRSAAAVPIEHFVGGLLENLFGKAAGPALKLKIRAITSLLN
jgi:hypothetical protein